MLSNLEYSPQPTPETRSNSISDYATILRSFDIHYKSAGYYYQVGEASSTQGWIIHLSAIASQIKYLLQTVIPFLRNKEIAFKIASSEAVSEDILNGNLGLRQIGKVVSIYPQNALFAVRIAKELISLTQIFKGPAIPTDICLGGIVYTRYGSFNPIIKLDPNGVERKYIYDEDCHLMEDLHSVPFILPNRVTWPFGELTTYKAPRQISLLNHIYKITDILKQDPKGNVYKGLYLKNLLRVKKCVIKQGFSNMVSDAEGRDIQDRLKWQHELHKQLSDSIPLPAVYDIYQEFGSTMLVMEYIRGVSLFEKVSEINPLSKHWQDLTKSESLRLLKYAIEITKVIDQIHKKGYVHRDVVPVNFLVDKKDTIILIDVELAYSIKDNIPNPPFRQGTPGFMSPQQATFSQPNLNDDIYGIGATLLYIFTGLLPVQFNSNNTQTIFENLIFVIGNREVAELISNCLQCDSEMRPTAKTIIETLSAYTEKIQSKSQSTTSPLFSGLNRSQLIEIVKAALKGLTQFPVVVMNDVWLSKKIPIDNISAHKTKQFTISPGLSEGISGVLYVLARVYRAGISIDPCMQGFRMGWQTLQNNYFNKLQQMPNGLYSGIAGMAMAASEGLKSGLVDDDVLQINKMFDCLTMNTEDLTLADGIAGQGLSVIHCKRFLKKELFLQLIDFVVQELLKRQYANGSWFTPSNKNKNFKDPYMSIRYDDVGITLFLLNRLALNPNTEVQNAVTNAILHITGNKRYMAFFYSRLASKDGYNYGDGGKGLLLLLIRAYDILHVIDYKKTATTALLKYPARIVHSNFTQENGLAALGEIYLEAYRVFKGEEWKNRADWIANFYIHSFFRNQDGSGHWVLEQNNPPTADFLTGISGVIHFLVRCAKPESIGCRLFN